MTKLTPRRRGRSLIALTPHRRCRSLIALTGLLLALLAGACGDDLHPAPITLFAPPRLVDLVTEWSAPLGDTVRVTEADDPSSAAAAPGPGVRVAVSDGLDCHECYRIDGIGDSAYQIAGDAPLGVQYGLDDLFEGLGFRFVHPFYTHVPDRPRASDRLTARLGTIHAPEVARRRGLHLHTLHPIEAYGALWDPAPTGMDEAHRIVDWIIKNRGNYLQWVALQDVYDPARHADWQAYTREVIDYAHRRGIEVGIGMELFGASDLQYGFNLVDDDQAPVRPQIEARFPLLTDGLPFDVYNLSFGEFIGADPDRFISAVDDAYDVMHQLAPHAEMLATVHVGNSPDLRVDYMGESLLYYFLVKYADPHVVPLIHTVMYYDLYEDAGGAYQHDDFHEHRQFLLDRRAGDLPAAYFPETAYWIAFDDSVPLYLPLYVRSRWLDLDHLAADIDRMGGAPLDQHILFSTGWEWGYWQNDWASLRASFERPDSWTDLFRDLYRPWKNGAELARLAIDLTDVEHDALMGQRLAAYMAGRDVYLDVGRQVGIISQPDRIDPADLVAMSASQRDDFAGGVSAGLDDLAAALAPLAERARPLAQDGDPVVRELGDGVLVTEARARFVAAIYRSALAHVAGDDDTAGADRSQAEAALADAKEIVARRHSHLFHPDPERLLDPDQINVTLYPFGYLAQADALCYWSRELAQLDLVLADQATGALPTCIM